MVAKLEEHFQASARDRVDENVVHVMEAASLPW